MSGADTDPTWTSGSSFVRREKTSQTCIALGHRPRYPGEDIAQPRVLVPHRASPRQSRLRHRAVAFHDFPELVPPWIAPRPLAFERVVGEVGVGNRDPEVPQLRHVGGEELLAQVFV